MRAERVYTSKTIAGYIVLCDDGEYHHTSQSLRILGCIVRDYIPRRIGRGAEDITNSPEGHVVLNTINAQLAERSAAALLGRIGGSMRSEAKATAARKNGRLGGRPRKSQSPQA